MFGHLRYFILLTIPLLLRIILQNIFSIVVGTVISVSLERVFYNPSARFYNSCQAAMSTNGLMQSRGNPARVRMRTQTNDVTSSPSSDKQNQPGRRERRVH